MGEGGKGQAVSQACGSQGEEVPALHGVRTHLFMFFGVYFLPSAPVQVSQLHDESKLALPTSFAVGCGLGKRCALAAHTAPARKTRKAR